MSAQCERSPPFTTTGVPAQKSGTVVVIVVVVAVLVAVAVAVVTVAVVDGVAELVDDVSEVVVVELGGALAT